MCRPTDYDGIHRYQAYRPRRLKIKGILLHLSTSVVDLLPEYLTLVFQPRINDSPLDVNGSKIRSDTPAYLTLHRLPSSNQQAAVVFASKDRVRVSDGLSFEVHLAQHRFLRGIFRNSDDLSWIMECKCVLDADVVALHVAQAELSVALEGQGQVIREKVAVRLPNYRKRSRRRRRCRTFQTFLEEIPEERERDMEEAQLEADDGNFCCCCSGTDDSDDEVRVEVEAETESPFVDPSPIKDVMDFRDGDMEEMIEDGVKWAVDVGFWVMCFGVGFLVSRASAKNFRRRKFLL